MGQGVLGGGERQTVIFGLRISDFGWGTGAVLRGLAPVTVLAGFFLAGCEGPGTLLLSNPLLARMAAVSEEEAEAFPPKKKYEWAYARYRIEAGDFRRGVRWRNRVKVRNASRRAVGFLIKMADLLRMEADRKAALETIERYANLGETLSRGRWPRSGEAASDDLHRFAVERLAPPRPLEGVPDAPHPRAGDGWIVRSKREAAADHAEGGVRYVLELSKPGGALVEREVSEKQFRAARVGKPWPVPPPEGAGRDGTAGGPGR
jgi:hypothetical protein